ncbi:PLP-dependent aminotransferase family protein [Micromonospora sp. NBC_00858]|uniref:aminotransferase-like domain-containing protein n=1 Tax=Micromonospora sp. NBC_00858 TaxID=2975979 RepID=UPI0038673E84|nr:PLP-dependent aminotransferase family protein [Micromonospora sp. NBC_00858]
MAATSRHPRRVTAHEFATLLGRWQGGTGELYRQLAERIRLAIQQGDLRAHTPVPPQRELAQALSVSRSTLAAALQILSREGFVEARRGSGTVVRDPSAPFDGLSWTNVLGMMPVFRQPDGADDGVVNLAAAGLDPHPALWESWTRVVRDAPQTWAGAHGYLPAGLPALRAAVAAQVSERGLPTEPGQILITAGAQQAIFLAASAWLSTGDTVLAETPLYAGALEALRSLGARVVHVPNDVVGPRPDDIERLTREHQPRFLLLSATCSNPSGRTLPTGRRREIAAACRRANVLLMEDAAQQQLLLGDEPDPGYLAQHCRPGQSVVVGSLSKLLWGGLRLGWLRADIPVIRNLTRLKGAIDLGSPVLLQEVAAHALASRGAELERDRRAQVSAAHDLAVGNLRQLIPDWQVASCSGGLALWVQLPRANAAEFASVALRHGVSVIPGDMFAYDGGYGDRLRVSFAATPPRLRLGIERLAAARQTFIS